MENNKRTQEINNNYRAIIDNCFVNAPFEQLKKDLLALFIRHRLRPEIGLEGNFLWHTQPEDFVTLAEQLKKHDLPCTLHAPFHDLVPGGFDVEMVKMSRKKLALAFSLIPIFKPVTMVCHLGFEDNKYQSDLERWLEISLTTWSKLIPLAAEAGTTVMFENTYESSPTIHKLFLSALSKEFDNVGFCLDTGHTLTFAGTGWQPWLEELAPWLGQLHLHDNDGSSDQHKAVGSGRFEFTALFNRLQEINSDQTQTPIITLEPHSKEAFWLSLENIKKLNLFYWLHTL